MRCLVNSQGLMARSSVCNVVGPKCIAWDTYV